MLSVKIHALLFLIQLHFQRTGRVCEEDMPVHCFERTNFGSLSQEAGRRLYLYGPIQILQNRRTVKQDESYKYGSMCSQENGRRSGSKSCSKEGVGVDVDNGDYQRTRIRSLKHSQMDQ